MIVKNDEYKIISRELDAILEKRYLLFHYYKMYFNKQWKYFIEVFKALLFILLL